MTKRTTLAVLMLALAVPVSAQQGTTTGGGSGQGAGQGRGTSQSTTPVQPGQRRGFAPAQAVNVRLDISINDQSSTGQQPIRKSISLLLADQSSGRVRSSGNVHQQVNRGTGPDGKPIIMFEPRYNVELNVDAAVELLQNEKMRATITLEYTPGAAPIANESLRPSPLNESVTVILQHGKPLIITQAADPLSDRKITVEVTGTILR